MNTTELLEKAVSAGASDIFVVAGRPVSMRIHGDIRMEDNTRLLPDDTRRIIEQIYELAGHRDIGILEDTGDDDFSFAVPGLSRFRVSAFKQRGSLSVVIRIISFTLPDPATFGIPEKIIRFADFSKGMVLVTGPAGSGKSTTLACIIDHINKNYDKHIITLEDPLEFLHRHNRSIVSQREINVDTENYVTALRASLRQSPDVILLGEMRDYETMQDCCRDRSSVILNTAYDRCCQHDRPYHRRLPAKSAETDRSTAFHGPAGSGIPAAGTDHRRRSHPCIRDYDRQSCDPQYDP